MLSSVFATEPTSFKHEKKILSILNEYMSNVDDKDINSMLNHLTIPVDLHFGSGRVVTVRSDDELKNIFNDWKNSPRSKGRWPNWGHLFTRVSSTTQGILN